VASFIKL